MADDHSQRPPWLGEDARGWDHVRVHIQVVKDDRLGANELAVYLGLAVHSELTSGESYPSKSTLGRYANLSERAVYNALTKLEKAGYLTVTQRPGMASIYRLLAPPPLGQPRHEVPPPGPTPAPGATHPGTTCQTTPAPGAEELIPGNKNHERDNESRVADGAPDAPLPGLDPPDHARALCDLFADSLGRRGKRPSVTAAWLTDMDLLLRVDGREPDKVRAVITWLESGGDDVASFWRPNIRSPRKLRSKWDQMQEQYQRARAASAPRPAAPLPGREQVMTDRSVSGRWTPTQTR